MKTSPKEEKIKEKPKSASKKKSLGSPENKPVNGQEIRVKVEDIKAEKSDEEIKTEPEEIKTEPEESSKIEPSNCLKLQAVGGGQKGFDYNPGKSKYDPIKDAFWKKGEK